MNNIESDVDLGNFIEYFTWWKRFPSRVKLKKTRGYKNNTITTKDNNNNNNNIYLKSGSILL